MDLCIKCKERPVGIEKRQLCFRCYQRLRKEVGKFITPENIKYEVNRNDKVHREIEFIKNFFKDSTQWIYEAAMFCLSKNGRYTPDFYDIKRNTFIEVSGTRQAYHKNKDKYQEFKETYPDISFEIRLPSGDLLDEKSWDKNWEQ